MGAQKVVIYGPEGIGKSTFASCFPNPVFIDTEGSTRNMDVARLPNPSSWSMLMDEVRHVKNNPKICSTLVIDTADWAEQLCSNELCAKSKKEGIEDFGYGKGYVYLGEEFGRLLNLLGELIAMGINVVFTAHAQMRKFEQPDEMGSYDRWEMKLGKKSAPLLKEWADMVLFANYKTYVVNIDGQGTAKGKNKPQGGARTMFTTHHLCWDAKNRHDLPEEVDFNYASIAHCIPGTGSAPAASVPEVKKQDPPKQKEAPKPEPTPEPTTPSDVNPPAAEPPANESKQKLTDIPKALADLMATNSVTVEEIQKAVASRGYYPVNTPIENYDPGFVQGVLIAAWAQVFQMIKNIRDDANMPF
jgi:hypothetical protein